MNKPQSNSFVSIIIFLCCSLVLILTITLLTEKQITPAAPITPVSTQ